MGNRAINSVRYVRDWYGRFERPISSISLIGGFVFDALTLKRVDMFWENVWVFVHLLVVAICIIAINIKENEGEDEKNPEKLHFWLVNILQFFFGGLLSTYLVFYFRSATLSVSWPFLLVLVAAFVANERLKHHFSRLSFQISLFFLSLFSFMIFLVPVVLHRIGPGIFLVSGIVSVVIMWFFMKLLISLSKENFTASKWTIAAYIGGIYALMNILYFTNIIPPIPLSLKDAGVFHSVDRNANGDYVVETEPSGFFSFFNLSPDVHLVSGHPVYAFSAVFSPASLNTNIIHEWQYQDAQGNWVTSGRISLPVEGGRDGGYRTYSIRANLSAGKWRVNVATPDGQLIGRMKFNVVSVSSDPITRKELHI
ncbi:MAG: hypothetical protein JWL80_435 [Parcubacteria group bacterium]|nr:hypothetical protein [Parcubacteria group bacterium]